MSIKTQMCKWCLAFTLWYWCALILFFCVFFMWYKKCLSSQLPAWLACLTSFYIWHKNCLKLHFYFLCLFHAFPFLRDPSHTLLEEKYWIYYFEKKHIYQMHKLIVRVVASHFLAVFSMISLVIQRFLCSSTYSHKNKVFTYQNWAVELAKNAIINTIVNYIMLWNMY